MSDVARLLIGTAARGELHHAIILHGPSPEALREIATGIARSLNCLNGSTGDDCLSCQRIDRQTHPDVHFIEVAADRKNISVEQVRELVAEATLRPYEGRNQVFIIDRAETLSPGASNSLLKTLEEPSRDTHFILMTRSAELLLSTIRSRSQAIHVAADVAIDDELAAAITDALTRFAEQGDSAALLSIASLIAQSDNPADGFGVLGRVLCDAVAGRLPLRLDKNRLLASADATSAAVRWLAVNADARLLAEQAIAPLIC